MNKGEGRGFYNLCLNVYRKLLTAVAVANIINAGKILTGNRIKLGRITRKVAPYNWNGGIYSWQI